MPDWAYVRQRRRPRKVQEFDRTRPRRRRPCMADFMFGRASEYFTQPHRIGLIVSITPPTGWEREVISHSLHRDASVEKVIQLAQRATLLSIAVTHGVPLSEQLINVLRNRDLQALLYPAVPASDRDAGPAPPPSGASCACCARFTGSGYNRFQGIAWHEPIHRRRS